MTDRAGTSPHFDRIRPHGGVSGGTTSRSRDGLGKEALYSTAPTASPIPQVELRCGRCDVPFGLSLTDLLRLHVPPFLWDPIRRRLWARCPACGRRAWLTVRAGQALRAWFDRPARSTQDRPTVDPSTQDRPFRDRSTPGRPTG